MGDRSGSNKSGGSKLCISKCIFINCSKNIFLYCSALLVALSRGKNKAANEVRMSVFFIVCQLISVHSCVLVDLQKINTDAVKSHNFFYKCEKIPNSRENWNMIFFHKSMHYRSENLPILRENWTIFLFTKNLQNVVFQSRVVFKKERE